MDTTGLILAPGNAGRCDDYRVGGAVVEHGADGVWRMWYYCRDRSFDKDAPPTLGSGRVALATSRDGCTWNRVDGPASLDALLDPQSDARAFDCLHLGLTDVTYYDGAWWMWCFGGDRTLSAIQAPQFAKILGLGMRCGLARSTDGLNWTRVPASGPGGALFDIDADAGYAAWPNAVHDGQKFVLHYTAPTLDMKTFRTRIAVSADGMNWTKIGALIWADGAPAYASTGIITRHVLPNPLKDARQRWLMVYTGTDAEHRRSIAAAESDDLITWRVYGAGPIFSLGVPGAWDDFGVAATRIVSHDGKLYLYYYGFQSLGADNGARGIGLAISDSGRLDDLRRYRP